MQNDGSAYFMLLGTDLKIKLINIDFDSRSYFAIESNSLNYISSFDHTSLDAIGFAYPYCQAIVGTTKTYFPTAFQNEIGFVEMTCDIMRKNPNFFANQGDVSTIIPAIGQDNSKSFTTITDTTLTSLPPVALALITLEFINLRFDFSTKEEAMLVFNKNEWQDEVCPPALARFDVTSCSYIEGEDYADCSLSAQIDFQRFTEVQSDIEVICSPLLYSGFLTQRNSDTYEQHSTPMILDKKILKYKSKIAASEAGVLTMYAMYSMTDTFIPKSFQIGIGIS